MQMCVSTMQDDDNSSDVNVEAISDEDCLEDMVKIIYLI